MHIASLILALAALLALSGCGTPPPATYPYHSEVTTGIGHMIHINGKDVPILFSEKSDPMARWSLCYLKSEVADAADNKFAITGTIEKHVRKPLFYRTTRRVKGVTYTSAEPEAYLLFRITDWKLKTPFNEYYFGPGIDIAEPFPLTVRHTLRRDDFTTSADFDPRQPGFDPASHLQKR
jgi:hypothetical protein